MFSTIKSIHQNLSFVGKTVSGVFNTESGVCDDTTVVESLLRFDLGGGGSEKLFLLEGSMISST
jgi:hypothetical protein